MDEQRAGSGQTISAIRIARGRASGGLGSGLVLGGTALLVLASVVLGTGATAATRTAMTDQAGASVIDQPSMPTIDQPGSLATPAPDPMTSPEPDSTVTLQPAGHPRLSAAALISPIAPASAAGPIEQTLGRVDQTYDLRVHLTVRTGVVDAIETLSVTNGSDATLDHLDLSAIPRALGIFDLTGPILVDGRPVDPAWTTTTNLRVATGNGLAPGKTATLVLPFRLRPGVSRGIFAARLGLRNGILDLGEWFPILSREHDAYGIGDPQVSFDARSITLDLTTDRALLRDAVAAGGVRVSAPRRAGRHWVFRAIHVRDFALAVAPDFQLTEGRVGSTTIRVYSTHGDGPTTLAIAGSALRFFNVRYGRYPYPVLTIAGSGAPGFSMEFPTIVLMAADRMVSPSTVAHEIAHQWFYGLLGNDQMTDPWVDEAFAQFSSHAFTHEADRTCSNRAVDLGIGAWTAGRTSGSWFECSGLVERSDGHGGAAVVRIRPLRQCPAGDPNCGGYYDTVYLRGAVLIDRIRRAMGDDAFYAALRELIADHRYGIVTTSDVLRFLMARAPRDLTDLVVGFVSADPAGGIGG